METSRCLVDAILVTGAGRRVGFHLIQRMLAQGRSVIAHYRTLTEGVSLLQCQGVLCVAADLATDAGVHHLIASVRSATSSLLAVVHNASAFEATAPTVDEALLQFDIFYAVHMRAPFVLNLAFNDLLNECSARRADII